MLDRQQPVGDDGGHLPDHDGHRQRTGVADLAFDIRALWYAQYDPTKPHDLAGTIREILERLFEQDLPDRQKRRFWDRFQPQKALRVFTGAIHVAKLNREMVGDWDVRTVSELFSYLPSVREATSIQLFTPLYSPEQAYKQHCQNSRAASPGPMDPLDWIKTFRDRLQNQISDCNAIVVASPDVNPITEYILHKAYRVSRPRDPFELPQTAGAAKFDGYVAVKLLESMPVSDTGEDDEHHFPRLFYTEEVSDGQKRGFKRHRGTHLDLEDSLLLDYRSQEQCSDDFTLLGHLVVLKYPPKSTNLIVLLNGVSGPATYGLAQILTGGLPHASSETKQRSEDLLRQINDILDDEANIGAEAIVRFKVKPAAPESTYMDTRQVVDWDFASGPVEPGEWREHGPKPIGGSGA